MTLPGFAAPERVRWTGGRSLVVYAGDRHCRRCTHGLTVMVGTFTQHALFRHGGYGAGEATDVAVCLSCGRTTPTMVATVRPPRNADRPDRRPV